MSEVMKRVEQIDDKIGDKKPMYISNRDFMHESAEGDMEFLISTIKQLHAENERYKKALEEIENGYRGAGYELEEALDKHFFGGISPVRTGEQS